MDFGLRNLHSIVRRQECDLIPRPNHLLHGHHALVRKMHRSSELFGHHSCVNRLAFDEDGTLLLSGSDDCSLRIWSVQDDTHVTPKAILTPGHVDNIFGVAFMPATENAYVVSAGLDQQVRWTNVETSKNTAWFCHNGAVKTVSPLDRNVFVSASKDGTARLFDVRIPPGAHSSGSFVVVNIPFTDPFSYGISSAIPSPTFSNHILISSGDAYLRVFDLRFSSDNRLTQTADAYSKLQPSCIESYCPSHLHDMAPEKCAPQEVFYRAYVTFATFSSDANQIVASYFMDAVHVFDRHNNSQSVACYPPFRNRAATRRFISWCLQNAGHEFQKGDVKNTIVMANRVLELEPENLLALTFKAESLLQRKHNSDFRVAYETLQQTINIVKRNPQSVAVLYGLHIPLSPKYISLTEASWQRKSEIWIMIFEFRQIITMLRMIPFQQDSRATPSVRNLLLTKRRFEHLRELCNDLIKKRRKFLAKQRPVDQSNPVAISTNCSTLIRDIRREALSFEDDDSQTYSTKLAIGRRQVLSGVVDKFAKGLDKKRFWLTEKIAGLPPHNGDTLGKYRLSSQEFWRLIVGEGDARNALAWEIRAMEATEKRILERFDSEVLWGIRPTKQPPCKRYHGHKSEHTDIKEARFFGSDNQVVLSGSDDCFVYMWSASTSELLNRVYADEQIVNCVLPHPYRSMIVASGIDSTIKVLTPNGAV